MLQLIKSWSFFVKKFWLQEVRMCLQWRRCCPREIREMLLIISVWKRMGVDGMQISELEDYWKLNHEQIEADLLAGIISWGLWKAMRWSMDAANDVLYVVWMRLKNELQQLVVPEEDTVCIYYLASSKYAGREQNGTVLKSTNII